MEGPVGLLLFSSVTQDSVHMLPISPWNGRHAEDWRANTMPTQPRLYFPQTGPQNLMEPQRQTFMSLPSKDMFLEAVNNQNSAEREKRQSMFSGK